MVQRAPRAPREQCPAQTRRRNATQARERARQAHTQRRSGEPALAGHLARCAALEQTLLDQRALVGVQRGERSLELGAQLARSQRDLGSFGLRRGQAFRIRDACALSALALRGDRQDADQPRQQGLVLVPACALLDRAHERVLQDVLGRASISGEAPGELVELGSGEVEDLRQGRRIAGRTVGEEKRVEFRTCHRRYSARGPRS